jgi:hypothetical protein
MIRFLSLQDLSNILFNIGQFIIYFSISSILLTLLMPTHALSLKLCIFFLNVTAISLICQFHGVFGSAIMSYLFDLTITSIADSPFITNLSFVLNKLHC